MGAVLFALGYLWALPLTLGGVVVALLGNSKFLRLERGALLFAAGKRFSQILAKLNIGAFTWGGCIVWCRAELADDARVVRHELRHFAQARLFGVLLPLLYVASSFIAWAEGESPYVGNVFEEDARKAERE